MHRCISMENVLAIGDAENDMSMLSIAGTSVAVANAKECVKNIATFTTAETNERTDPPPSRPRPRSVDGDRK